MFKISMAALCLSAAVFVGCDSKDNTVATPSGAPTSVSTTDTTVTTPTMTTPTVTTPTVPATPAAPDMSKASTAVNNAIDKGTDSVKSAADKLMNRAPTTAPSMPDMPAMPK